MENSEISIDQLKKAIDDSGFPFELTIAKEMMELGYEIKPSFKFFDPMRKKDSEIDLVASKYQVMETNTGKQIVVMLQIAIECKVPSVHEPISEAIKQLTRYQELDDEFKDRGAPKLFETVQILIATCSQSAKYGTVGTPQSKYMEWKDAFPLSLDL